MIRQFKLAEYFPVENATAELGVRHFVCDLNAEMPTSNLNIGDELYCKENGKVYRATNSTTWTEHGGGAQGPAGPQGPQGPEGPQGLQGLQGNAGVQGDIGPQGPQGDAGLQGIQGPQGDAGATGPQGPQGIQGIQGEVGPQGPIGPQGPSVWGGITGTISTQTDLQNALNAKANTLGPDDNYVTDAEKVKLTNLSGTNTGDQVLPTDATITTSDVTTNNASVSKHGWLPKLPGGTTTFLRADGTFATPPAGGGGTWTTIIKTADEARVNNTVSADSVLKLTTTANTQYVIKLRVWGTTNATADSRYQLTHSGTTTRVRRRIIRTATGSIPAFVTMGTAFDAAPVVLTTTGLDFYVEEYIVLQVGASGGLLEFKWGQVTTNAGATTVLEGSHIEYAIT